MARRRAPKNTGIGVSQLIRSLDRGEIAQVYLISGSDDFLRRKASASFPIPSHFKISHSGNVTTDFDQENECDFKNF